MAVNKAASCEPVDFKSTASIGCKVHAKYKKVPFTPSDRLNISVYVGVSGVFTTSPLSSRMENNACCARAGEEVELFWKLRDTCQRPDCTPSTVIGEGYPRAV
ncbi:hypothetical protein TorRG33x02_312920, partial [Trema orientale]